MAKVLGKSPEDAYRQRHEDRMLWFHALNELRAREGPTCLVRRCLAHSDVVCGLRNKVELEAGRAEGLLDLVVWVDRPTLPDPTVEFTIEDADIIVRNHTTLGDFYGRLERLARTLNILPAGL